MSQENVEVVRRGVEAWNQHDADLWLSYAAPEIEWMPAGPAAVERTVYRGYEEVATGFAALWETWEEFRFQESEVRDLGDSVLWLGRAKMKGGASLASSPAGPPTAACACPTRPSCGSIG